MNNKRGSVRPGWYCYFPAHRTTVRLGPPPFGR